MLYPRCAYVSSQQLPAKPQVGQLKTCARSSTDRASDYGSEGWGFESLRARPGQSPFPSPEGARLLTRLLTARPLAGSRYCAGEDVGGLGELVADDVGVHAQRDRGVRVAEPGRDHVHASQQQGCRVWNMPVGCCSFGKWQRPAADIAIDLGNAVADGARYCAR